jgi:hypothetical protein
MHYATKYSHSLEGPTRAVSPARPSAGAAELDGTDFGALDRSPFWAAPCCVLCCVLHLASCIARCVSHVAHVSHRARFVAVALLANANAGGENVARGALLGALFGASIGASQIPAHLKAGLRQSAAIEVEIDAFVDRCRGRPRRRREVSLLFRIRSRA